MDIYGEMVHPSDSMVMMKQCLYMLSVHVSGHGGSKCTVEMMSANMHIELERQNQDTLAERCKAVAQGAIPEGRGLEPHRCQLWTYMERWCIHLTAWS